VKKVLKWIGIILGGLVGLVLVAAAVVIAIGSARVGADLSDAPVEMVDVPDGEAAVARGQHIAETRYCGECHGEDLAGTDFMNEEGFAVLPAPNLTPAGVGGDYTDEDWIRALRHGVGGDGRPLIIMPSEVYTHLGDEDLGALIAYLKTLEPVENDLPARQIGIPARALIALGQFPLAPSLIAQENVERPAPEPGVTVAYGTYIARTAGCALCHGEGLAGGVDPETNAPTPNLTPAGELGSWSEADFITAMREGTRPDGTMMSSELMPWQNVGQMTDEELSALWSYLENLPAAE
jgi:cytochrome c553